MVNKKGFTLIELLVVIGIIGILAGSMIVLMRGHSESARNSKLKAEINQISKALAMYKYINNFAPYPVEETVCLVKDCVAEQISVTTGLSEEIWYQTDASGSNYVVWALRADAIDDNDYYYIKNTDAQVQDSDDLISAPTP